MASSFTVDPDLLAELLFAASEAAQALPAGPVRAELARRLDAFALEVIARHNTPALGAPDREDPRGH